MTKKNVVVDTNVIVSGLLGSGHPARIIEAWFLEDIQSVISLDLQREVNRILQRPNIKKILGANGSTNIKSVVGTLFNKALVISPQPILEEVFSDRDDHFLWELAVTAKAVAIVTGDKELVIMRKVKGIEILNPEQFCRKFKIK